MGYKFGSFCLCSVHVRLKVLGATIPVTLAASLAARLGATSMAAFQICLQVWLTLSLLSDGLAVAGQAIIASSFAERNYEKATTAASRVLQVIAVGPGPLNVEGVRIGVPLHSRNTVLYSKYAGNDFKRTDGTECIALRAFDVMSVLS